MKLFFQIQECINSSSNFDGETVIELLNSEYGYTQIMCLLCRTHKNKLAKKLDKMYSHINEDIVEHSSMHNNYKMIKYFYKKYNLLSQNTEAYALEYDNLKTLKFIRKLSE